MQSQGVTEMANVSNVINEIRSPELPTETGNIELAIHL
jgi:hypothetical protein